MLEAIHELLQVTPILPKGGFIENDERGTQGNARSQRSPLLLTDGQRKRAACAQVDARP